MKLKGVRRQLIKHYVFAQSVEDFTEFTGLQPRNGYNHVKTDKERFIWVEIVEDVKKAEKKYPSQVKWRSSITDKFVKENSPSYIEAIKFFCKKEIDMDNIPKTLRGFM